MFCLYYLNALSKHLAVYDKILSFIRSNSSSILSMYFDVLSNKVCNYKIYNSKFYFTFDSFLINS